MHRSDGGLRWADVEVILALCRAGSLSGAARRLGLNHSTVFRRINAIEERTAVRFFDRLPNGYRMTEAGQSALIHAERIESEMLALGREVLGQDLRIEGPVRVTAPEGMAALVLPQLMLEFAERHPGISIEISGTSTALDLNRREAEVAIRATRKPPDFALGRRICGFRFGVYAARDRAEALGQRPLAERPWVLLAGMESWLVPHIWRNQLEARERIVVASSSIISVVNLTVGGGGLTVLPFYLGEVDDRLVRLEIIDALDLELWVLTHPDLKHTARVKVLMDYLYEQMEARRETFEG